MSHEAHRIIRVPDGNRYALRCSCSCGWQGPTRDLAEPTRLWRTLLEDDEDWHDEKISSGPR